MEIAGKVEREIIKLHSENDLLKKQLRSAEAVQRDVTEDKSVMKKNASEIKQLRLEVEELKVRKKRQDTANEELIQKALEERCQDKNAFKGYNGKELIQLVDSKVLDLSMKSNSLAHSIQLAKRTLTRNQQILEEMDDICRDCHSLTETDCLQRMQDLEADYHKTLKKIEESEDARNKYITILEHLKEISKSQCYLFNDLMKQIESDPEKTISEMNNTDAKDILKNKSNIELTNLEKDLSRLKEATECKQLNEIESRILDQISVHQDMIQLNRKAKICLQDLKVEKAELSSKMAQFKEPDDRYPKNAESVPLARSQMKDQEIRRDTAKSEFEALNSIHNEARLKLTSLIEKIQPETNKKKLNNVSLGGLASYLENIINRKCSTKRCGKNNIEGKDIKVITERNSKDDKHVNIYETKLKKI